MHWFRRNQKYFLIGLCCLLIITWLTGSALRQIFQSGSQYVGRIHGSRVTVQELQNAKATLGLEARLTGSRYRPTDEDAWGFLVMLAETDRAGVSVSPDDLRNYIRTIIPDATAEKYQQFLKAIGMSANTFETMLRQKMTVQRFQLLLMGTDYYTPKDLWYRYEYQNDSVKLKFVTIDPRILVPLVQVDEAGLKEWYAKYKEVIPDAQEGRIGYKDPERFQFHYVLAKASDFENEVKVTDEEIKAYYDEHKEEFRVREQPKPAPLLLRPQTPAPAAGGNGGGAEAPKKAEQPTAAPKPAEAKAAPKPDEPKPAEPAPKPVAPAPAPKPAEPKPASKPQYRPLKDVAKVIELKLKTEKADQKAAAVVEQVLDEIIKILKRESEIGAFSFEQIAQQFKIQYGTTGPKPLTGEELLDFYPGGLQLSQFAQGKDVNLYDYRKIVDGRSHLVCQLIDRKPPTVLTYEEAKAQVRKDYAYEMALRKATTYGKDLMLKAEKYGLTKACELEDKALAAALEAAPKKPEPKKLLKVEETGFFTRHGGGQSSGVTMVPGLGANKDNIVKHAFELPLGKFAVVPDGKPRQEVYVIQTAERREADAAQFIRQRTRQEQFLQYMGAYKTMSYWKDVFMKESKSDLIKAKDADADTPGDTGDDEF